MSRDSATPHQVSRKPSFQRRGEPGGGGLMLLLLLGAGVGLLAWVVGMTMSGQGSVGETFAQIAQQIRLTWDQSAGALFRGVRENLAGFRGS